MIRKKEHHIFVIPIISNNAIPAFSFGTFNRSLAAYLSDVPGYRFKYLFSDYCPVFLSGTENDLNPTKVRLSRLSTLRTPSGKDLKAVS
jgi:hypothetical protein